MQTEQTISSRVAVLELRMNEHDTLSARLERKVDGLVSDVSVLKTDVSVLKTDVSGIKAGQIELRDMVATLLARSEGHPMGS
ncbi:MAG: hypothetical protein JWN52_4529 [Actinomycetia bacterium]|nr:hypothetical protein [Actinomycetes bacterium]